MPSHARHVRPTRPGGTIARALALALVSVLVAVGAASPAAAATSRWVWDDTFNANVGAGSLQLGDAIEVLAVDERTGDVVVGGWYHTGNRDVARFSADGQRDEDFDANVVGAIPNGARVRALVIDPVTGAITLGLDFTSSAEPAVVRLHADGRKDHDFPEDFGLRGTVNALLVDPADGAITVGGTFIGYPGLARFAADGTPDAAFNAKVAAAGLNEIVFDIAQDPATGALTVGGSFDAPGQRLARFAADGTPDAAFNTNLGSVLNNQVVALDLDPSTGATTIGGSFATAGVTRYLARVGADGHLDAGFSSAVALDTDTIGPVLALSVNPRTGIVTAGGSFPTGLAQFDPENEVWLGDFLTGVGGRVNDVVRALHATDDGVLTLAGDFTTPGTRLARITQVTVDTAPIPHQISPLGVPIEPLQVATTITNGSTPIYSATGLPDGLSIDPGTGVISGTPTAAGSFSVQAGATSSGVQDRVRFTWTVGTTPTLAGDPTTGRVGEPYDFAFTVGGDPAPTVAVTGGALPEGLTLDPDGRLHGTPTRAGAVEFEVTATSLTGLGKAVHPTTVQITGPTTLTGDPPDGVVGTAYEYAFALDGFPAPTVRVTGGALPDGLTLEPDGRLHGTPTVGGDFTFDLAADNGTDTARLAGVTVVVTERTSINRTPPDGVVGSPYQHRFTEGGHPAPTVTVTGGALPDGLTLDPDGRLHGTPTVGGEFTFAVGVFSAAGDADFAARMTVTAPTTLAGTPPGGAVGEGYEYAFAVAGYPTPTVTVTGGALPDGLTLDPDGRLHGTPTVGGDFTVDVTADNGIDSAVLRGVPLTVTAPPSLAGDPPGGAVGETYEYAFTVAGHPAPAVEVTGGGLPDGLTLDPDGRLHGTPTVGGESTFELTAGDGADRAVLPGLTVTITAPTTLAGDPPLGTVGGEYEYGFALGGFPVPTVAVTGGALPDGLTLDPDGRLNGTPTAGGEYTVDLTAENGRDSATLTGVRIEVLAPVIEVGHAQVTPGQEQTVTGTGFVPGEVVAVVLTSEPVDLGPAVADESGALALTFVVPVDTAAGTHTVTTTSLGGAATSTFEVTAVPDGPGEGPGGGAPGGDPGGDGDGSGSGSGGRLALTGGQAGALALLVAALLVAGVLVLRGKASGRSS